MSQENVEIVRGMYDAFNRGDADAAGAPLHPEVELHQAPDMPDTDVYYGLEEFRRGFVQWLSAWEGFCFDPEEILGRDRGRCPGPNGRGGSAPSVGPERPSAGRGQA